MGLQVPMSRSHSLPEAIQVGIAVRGPGSTVIARLREAELVGEQHDCDAEQLAKIPA